MSNTEDLNILVPNVTHRGMIENYFSYDHLPEFLAKISKPFRDLAVDLASRCNPSAAEQSDPVETTAALRKLLEAKDCAVRARLAGGEPWGS